MILLSKHRFSTSVRLSLLLLLTMSVAVLKGPIDISFITVISVFLQPFGITFDSPWRPWVETVIMGVRLPRIIVAALVGGAWPWPA